MNNKTKKDLEQKREAFAKEIENYKMAILRTEGAIMLLNEMLEEK